MRRRGDRFARRLMPENDMTSRLSDTRLNPAPAIRTARRSPFMSLGNFKPT